MSINKDIHVEIHDEYIGEDEIQDKYIGEDDIVDKNIFDEIHDEYIGADKIADKDIRDEIQDKYIGEDDIVDKDIFDKIHDEYIVEDKIVNNFLKDNDTKAEDFLHLEESKISINCKLKVDFDTKNKMIYLYPGKSQYFTVDVLKCYGCLLYTSPSPRD